MKLIKFIGMLSTVTLLCSCGTSNTLSSNNLVCAFVEGYLSTKALTLTSLSQGVSASSSIESLVGGISDEIPENTEADQIFDEFLVAMSQWATRIDNAYGVGDAKAITSAAIELETRIDPLAVKCENLGWSFEKDWR